MRGKGLTQQQIKEIIRLYLDGYTSYQVSEKTGVKDVTVQALLHRKGIRRFPPYTTREIDSIREQFLAGVPPKEIAKNHGRKRDQIYGVIKRYGFEKGVYETS